MAADRDFAVAVARALARLEGRRPRTGWEMLAATGARGLRVLNESPWLGSLLLTELDPHGFRVLEENTRRYAALGASCSLWDARKAPTGAPFDVVDLDPYGTPAPFVDAAFDAVRPGGVLAVTATDMRVLAGAEPGACERRYGARPLRGRLGPECGLRILIAWLSRVANARGLDVLPLVAYVRGHHVRTYLRVLDARANTRPPVGTIDPSRFDGPRLPPRGPFGPMWLGPLLDPAVVGALELPEHSERPREVGPFIDRMVGEVRVDVPFYYEANELARSLVLERPPRVDRLIAELGKLGWNAARTSARAGAFRTTAPRRTVERAAVTIARSAVRG